MKRNLLILAIILLIGLIVNSCGGGGDDEQPKPGPQKEKFNVTTQGGTANVTINYVALPGNVPSHISTLSAAVKLVLPGYSATGALTINVIDGNSGFVKTDSKTLSVGKSWLSGKDVSEIGIPFESICGSWAAMIQPTHDNGWKQLRGHFVKITNANTNLLNVVYKKEKLIPCRCTSLYNDNYSGGKIKEYLLLST